MRKYKTYKVLKRDNLLDIAEKFNVNFEKLARLNGLTQFTDYRIKVGQELKLPIYEENPTEK